MRTRERLNQLSRNEDLKKKIRTCSRECLSIQRHHRRFWSWKCTPLSVLPWVSLGFAPRCSWWHRFGKTKLLNSWLRHVLTSVDASSESSKKKMNSSSKIKKKKIFVGVVQIHAARQTRMKTSSLSRCSQKSEYLRVLCVRARLCVCVNSNEDIPFSVFSSKATVMKRHEEPQKNIRVPLCQSATSRYFWRAREKRKQPARWIWPHDTSKKVKQREFYIQKYRKG